MDRKFIAVLVGIVLLAAIPLVCQLTKEPVPITVDDIKAVYRARNFSVANERPVSRPRYQADAEAFMTINGAQVYLFTYSNVAADGEMGRWSGCRTPPVRPWLYKRLRPCATSIMSY